MGLNGAFLTGDLFNLFVFFEILLAASYGLLLHGSGVERIRAGSTTWQSMSARRLFLIGVRVIYGVAGTLNMADLATIIQTRPGPIDPAAKRLCDAWDRFSGEGGMCRWVLASQNLRCGRTAAAALFAILRQSGVYALLRVYLLMFGGMWAGRATSARNGSCSEESQTLAFGTIGVLAVSTLSRVAGYCVIISSGTILATIGAGEGKSLQVRCFIWSALLGTERFYLLLELWNAAKPRRASRLWSSQSSTTNIRHPVSS